MGVAVEEIRAQVERLLQSKTFETSETHRHLLQYLAEKSLSGEADRLKEYTIGLEAFGKPESYDPKHDSIVRLQVSRLRQKLAAYYQAEGPADPVVIQLPKGAFKLTFEAPANGEPHPPRPMARWVLAALVLALVWAVAATVLMVRARSDAAAAREPWSPELETLWGPFLQSKRPALVCLGTPLFVRFPAFGFFRDPKVNDWQEIEKSERLSAVRKALGDREIFAAYSFTGAGEASAAFQIARLLATRKRDLLLTRSSILSWQQIVDDDVIFIGPPKFNLQLQASPLTQDIVVEPNGIRNLRAKEGEPAFLEDHMVPGKPSEGVTHALISRRPGLSGVGESLVIAGNASADTLAAAEWLTQPWRAKELAQHLRLPSGEVPRYFEVVLKVSFRQGIPVQSSYVFHHVLNPPVVR
jgi:hypothetical protein